MSELAMIQQQFYDFVTKGSAADGLIATGDLKIYARMYASRLHDAIAGDYPKLQNRLGHDEFASLVYRFIVAHPPQSFTLRDAGLKLGRYLRSSADASVGVWAAELAELERARVECFDARDAAPLQQDAVAALGDALPDLVLRWVPASAMVTLTTNVDDIWSAIEDGTDVPAVALAQRVVLVWRRATTVVHRTLDDDEAALAPMMIAGATFTEVCDVLATQHGEQAAPRAVELLLRWLQAEALDDTLVARSV
ncbi:MAG TPA: DNA-binding domain-containing protein [Kofleriaceae bacterium]|jgi:hypothetical protein|nr:DNA-binding domain-containing protein [Kofleriaceae bacterium]